jgi:uncharacterized protein YunC (DUF1805 family)
MTVVEQQVTVGTRTGTGVKVDLPGAPVLMLVGAKGFLGCGYFRTDVADKVGHALAVVSGVKSFDDMLAAEVRAVSAAAAALGITPGMSGRDAAARLA